MTDDRQRLNVVTLKEYVDTRFAAVSESTRVANEALGKRLDGMNEFRDTLRDQAARLATRQEQEAILQRLSVLENWRASQEGKASQNSVTWATILAVMGLSIGMIGLLVNLVR